MLPLEILSTVLTMLLKEKMRTCANLLSAIVACFSELDY